MDKVLSMDRFRKDMWGQVLKHTGRDNSNLSILNNGSEAESEQDGEDVESCMGTKH